MTMPDDDERIVLGIESIKENTAEKEAGKASWLAPPKIYGHLATLIDITK